MTHPCSWSIEKRVQPGPSACGRIISLTDEAVKPALEVVTAHHVPLHGWRRAGLESVPDTAGFTSLHLYDAMADVPHVDGESTDVAIVAR